MIAEAFQAINSLRATVGERDQTEKIDNHEVDPPFETRMDQNVAEKAQVDTELDSSEVEALKEACAPLFNDARISKLSFVIILPNIFATHGCPNIALDELLSFLQQTVLPTPNLCPRSRSQAKVIVRKLGLNYISIHACPSGCVLFKGEYENLRTCPKCGAARYKEVGRNSILEKVLRYFPVIPCLQRMYKCREIAYLLTWSARHKSSDGLIRNTRDSKQLQHIDNKWQDFAAEPRNIRFGLALDVADGVLIPLYPIAYYLLSKTKMKNNNQQLSSDDK
ncbi:hypothetical protein R1sor_016617 [Riccia sorocarpa]|uniref:Transposase n=1 Tax=Riccia sorocarpa TaxID=122646 RepID=A0ABD3HFY2_9MARC